MHQNWEANPLQALTDTHTPGYYGEALHHSYVTEIHISNIAFVTASKPQREHVIMTIVLIIQTLVIYLHFMWE